MVTPHRELRRSRVAAVSAAKQRLRVQQMTEIWGGAVVVCRRLSAGLTSDGSQKAKRRLPAMFTAVCVYRSPKGKRIPRELTGIWRYSVLL